MSGTEGYYESLNSNRRQLAFHLQGLIMAAAPGMEESLSYKIPFFSRHKKICYLSHNKEGMYLGFLKGHQMSLANGLLSMQGRKQVASVSYRSVEDVDESMLYEVLQEALLLDEIAVEIRKQR